MMTARMATGSSRSVRDSARRRRRRAETCRSTARARRSPIRSTRSGSASTTSCTRTSRSTTRPSGRAPASGRSRRRPCSSAPRDGPMTNDQLLAAPGTVLHFPTVLGAVVPIYNIPNVAGRAEVHGPGARRHLPRQDHEVERPGHRADQSGRHPARRRTSRSCTARTAAARPTSGATYLAKVSPEWKKRVGVAHVRALAGRPWRSGQRRRDGTRQADAGAIGYVELVYALQNKMSYGSVQNSDRSVRQGQHRRASRPPPPQRARRAMPADFRVSITNAPGTDAYPISSFTWMLFYESPRTRRRARRWWTS